MTDWADKDANERLQARDRRRSKRRAAVRASGAACGIDPAKVCGLTQKPCAYAADCAMAGSNDHVVETAPPLNAQNGKWHRKRRETLSLVPDSRQAPVASVLPLRSGRASPILRA